MITVDLVIPLAVSGRFTYAVPPELEGLAERGKLVVVQFSARRHYVGLILEKKADSQGKDLKSVIEVLKEFPPIDESVLRFWEWISEYYLCEWGEVLTAALPAGIKLDHQLWVDCGDKIDDEDSPSLLRQLPDDGWQIEELSKRMGADFRPSTVQKWVRAGYIILRDNWEKKHKRPGLKALRFGCSEDEIEAFLRRSSAPRQKELVLHLWEQLDLNKAVLRSSVSPRPFSSAILKGLIDKGVVEEYLLDPEVAGELDKASLQPLTPVQEAAYVEILDGFERNKPVLLYGVTSSGKTEIYTHLILKQLKEKKQALFLLPEIALTTQMIERMRRAFGQQVLVYHSKMPESRRSEVWQRVLRGDPVVIVGARSALLLPFKRLGIVVVDEEHEPSYKQQDPAPRYQARDAAIYLSHITQAKVILGSATPSLESISNSQNGRFHKVELLKRFGDRPLPQLRLLPINQLQGHQQGIGNELENAIERNLHGGRQVILFQNRRGFAPYIICEDCGHIPQCPNCDISLSFHQYGQQLRCHYCGHKQKYLAHCAKCHSSKVHQQGIGTQRLEERLKSLFPNVGIERLDTDSARGRQRLQRLIDDFESGKTKILIGTQMVTKGLDFRNVGLVGIVSADDLLSFPDFRNTERAYQLIAQVAGRAGRGAEEGQVLIQARNTKHPLLKDLRDHAYARICEREIYQRQAYAYPPFTRLIRILLAHKDRDAVFHAARKMNGILRPVFGNSLLGPEQPGVARLKNRFLQQFMLKMPREYGNRQTKDVLRKCLQEFEKHSVSKGIRVVLDVDPM